MYDSVVYPELSDVSAPSGLTTPVDIPSPTRTIQPTLPRTPSNQLSIIPLKGTFPPMVFPIPIPKFPRESNHPSSPNIPTIRCSTYRPTCYDYQSILPHGTPRCANDFPKTWGTTQRAKFPYKTWAIGTRPPKTLRGLRANTKWNLTPTFPPKYTPDPPRERGGACPTNHERDAKVHPSYRGGLRTPHRDSGILPFRSAPNCPRPT